MKTARTVGRRERSVRIAQVSDRQSIRQDRRIVSAAGLPTIALLALAACSGQSDTSTSGSAATSPETVATSDAKAATSVAEVDCDLEVQLTVAAPTCYAVTVPEDWSNPTPDDPVVIQAAVFHATNPDKAANDPVIYLEGGPGLGTLGGLKWLESAVVKPFLETRDVILFDQRGTGDSTPSLACSWERPDFSASVPDDSDPSAPTDTTDMVVTDAPDDSVTTEMTDDADTSDDIVITDGASASTDASDETGANTEMLDLTAECHRQLTADGVNLAAYNSIASAKDVDAIRSGLGYDKVNVVGISYGTRLAQTYMRMFPDSTRSVVIDSVDPVAQSMFETEPVRAQQALQNLFDRCRADTECNDAYPNFEADFFALVARLNAEPALFDLIEPDGTTVQAGADGNDLINLTYSSLYEKSQLARLPEMVTEAMDGNFEIVSELYGAEGGEEAGDFSSAMWNSVQCNERVPFESAAQREANIQTEGEFSALGGYFRQSESMFDTCAVWPAGRAPAVENQPVVSEIPTLLLTGSFDPVTPPSFARSVAEHLANSTVVEFPSEGHRALQTDCARDLARTFVDDPSQSLDTACVANVVPPEWVKS